MFSMGDNLKFNGDISVIKNFTSLTRLSLGDTWYGRMEYSPLETMLNLENLALWGASQLTDATIVGNLTNLKNLTIHASKISDFLPLASLVSLTRLDLQYNRIRDVSAVPLESFPHLSELYLWGNEIIDITSLRKLTALTALGLDNNQITNITPLSDLNA